MATPCFACPPRRRRQCSCRTARRSTSTPRAPRARTAEPGLWLSGRASVTIQRFTVTRADDKGIYVLSGSSAVVVANDTTTLCASNGIGVYSSTSCEVRNNRVSDNGDHGIAINLSSGCTISGNESFRNARPEVRAANGINLTGATGNRLERNRWHDNQDSGEQYTNGSNNNVSILSVSYDNGDHGFDHLASTGNLHLNNVSHANFR